MILSILSWILFGLVVGLLARFLLPGRDPMGWIATTLLGVAGSFFGGLVASLFTGGPAQLQATHFLGSLLGAIALLLVGRLVAPRTSREHR